MIDIWKLLIFIIRVASCRMPEKPGTNLLCLYLLLYLYHYTSICMIMGPSGMELILFIACMMLHFEFVTKTVLITHQCFGYFWAEFAQHKGIFFFPLCPQQWISWGCTNSWEEIHDRNWPKGYSKPCSVVHSNMLRKSRRKQEHLQMLPDGKEWINSLFWFSFHAQLFFMY